MIIIDIDIMTESSEVFEIKNIDGLEYLSTIPDGSVDLILTDPPYIISKETGMNAHYNKNIILAVI